MQAIRETQVRVTAFLDGTHYDMEDLEQHLGRGWEQGEPLFLQHCWAILYLPNTGQRRLGGGSGVYLQSVVVFLMRHSGDRDNPLLSQCTQWCRQTFFKAVIWGAEQSLCFIVFVVLVWEAVLALRIISVSEALFYP